MKNLLKALKLCIKEHGKCLDDRDIFAATAALNLEAEFYYKLHLSEDYQLRKKQIENQENQEKTKGKKKV